MSLEIRPAVPADLPLILQFIHDLADYVGMANDVVATEARLHNSLFGAKPAAECLLAFVDRQPAGFAVFFTNYSTFLAQPGLYLEDLFVRPTFRRRGIGKALLLHLARLANSRDCGRFEWIVVNWNESAKSFYRSLGATQLDDKRVFRLTGAELKKYV